MIKAALIGAGQRGMFAYGSYALKRPNEIQFVAVAEPIDEKRERFAREHSIPVEKQFRTWEEMLAQPKLCEALLICTQDRHHYEPVMRALNKGYHILLEKPMSPEPLEAIEMAEEAEKHNRILTVCHTMRFSNYFKALKEIVDKKLIGDIMTVQWTENVGFWHQAHSFVRGNWRNSQEASPMILQKSCHDMDMLQWLIGDKCESVSSFGELSFFKKENAPEGSTERCIDGCVVEHECPFSAVKVYLNEKDEWPQNVVSLDNRLETRLQMLKNGPYGRCVYRCDNNVVDHQVVNLRFQNQATVSFTMTAFTVENTRTFKIMGTKGEIRGHGEKNEIQIHYFSGKRETVYPETIEGGHEGADTIIMSDFVKQVTTGNINGGSSTGSESARTHLIAFAAEKSRVTGKTVDLNDYIRELKDGVKTV